MKAIIENSVIFMEHDERNHAMLSGFNYILQAITTSKNETELRKKMDTEIGNFRYFKYGFGANHMCVHQKDVRSDSSTVNEAERILIVEF